METVQAIRWIDNASIIHSQCFVHQPMKRQNKQIRKPKLSKQLTNISNCDLKRLHFKTKVPERIIRQALQLFDEFDVDKKGFIKYTNVKSVLSALGIYVSVKKLDYILYSFNIDQNTRVCPEELLHIIQRVSQSNNREQDNILCAFVSLGGNTDKSGHLSCRKLEQMLKEFDLDLDIDALVQLLDKDKNGTVEFDEFSALFVKAKNAFRPKTPRPSISSMKSMNAKLFPLLK